MLTSILHLLLAGTLDAALAEVRDLGAGNQSLGCLVDLLASPLTSVRMPIGVQQLLEFLRDVHELYDTKRHTVQEM
jgi:hypothetical protein